MTNGLTKTAKATLVAGVVGVPAIPPRAAQYVLTPPPPGYYYVWVPSAGEYQLVAGTGGSYPTGSYTIVVNENGWDSAIYFTAGTTLTFGFAPTYGAAPTQSSTIVLTDDGVREFPDPPTGLVLVSVKVTPPAASTSSTAAKTYSVPNGVQAVRFTGAVYENGYPTSSPRVGTFLVPNPFGGFITVSRSYTARGDGVMVPTTSTDGSNYHTSSKGVRQVLIDAFAGAPEVPATPSYTVYENRIGWDAGANSIATVDGNLYVKFQVPFALGAKVGLFNDGTRVVTDVTALHHAFYIYANAQGRGWAIVDNGVVLQFGGGAEVSTTYEIRRVGSQVAFFVDDALVYVSKNASNGAQRVGSILYATGDQVL